MGAALLKRRPPHLTSPPTISHSGEKYRCEKPCNCLRSARSRNCLARSPGTLCRLWHAHARGGTVNQQPIGSESRVHFGSDDQFPLHERLGATGSPAQDGRSPSTLGSRKTLGRGAVGPSRRRGATGGEPRRPLSPRRWLGRVLDLLGRLEKWLGAGGLLRVEQHVPGVGAGATDRSQADLSQKRGSGGSGGRG